jgi:hypothetical protein
VPGWPKGHDRAERIKECVAVLDKKWRQHTGCLRDWHPCGVVSIGAARLVTKEHGRKGAGANWFPQISFEADLSGGKLYRLRNHRLLGLAQSAEREQQKARQQMLDSHGAKARCTNIPQTQKSDDYLQVLLVIVGSQSRVVVESLAPFRN